MEEIFVPEGSFLSITSVVGGLLIRYQKNDNESLSPPEKDLAGTGSTLTVLDFSPQTNKQSLHDIFSPFGRISRIIPCDLGYYIVYEDRRDALDALREMNGVKINGSRLTVEL